MTRRARWTASPSPTQLTLHGTSAVHILGILILLIAGEREIQLVCFQITLSTILERFNCLGRAEAATRFGAIDAHASEQGYRIFIIQFVDQIN